MDQYGGYVGVALLILTALFFIMAIYNIRRKKLKAFKYTAYGISMFILIGVCLVLFTDQGRMMQIALVVFIVLGAVHVCYAWFYGDVPKDKENQTEKKKLYILPKRRV